MSSPEANRRGNVSPESVGPATQLPTEVLGPAPELDVASVLYLVLALELA
jgi:hypothetical protein